MEERARNGKTQPKLEACIMCKVGYVLISLSYVSNVDTPPFCYIVSS